MIDLPLDPGLFEERLRFEGGLRYHDQHPFHVRMHEGRLSRRELALWVENRYYYQTRLPIKDALIVAKSENREFRRAWAERLVEQDGKARAGADDPDAGGLELWLALAEAVGLDRGRVESFADVLPRVRRACDRYVDFVREATLVEAVASSLTECFAPDLMEQRILAWERHYPWAARRARGYFERRVRRARVDSTHGLELVLTEAVTHEAQELCVDALILKCEILWEMLDAIDAASTFADRPPAESGTNGAAIGRIA
jgi:pyrroloquinoline-quinone synthase